MEFIKQNGRNTVQRGRLQEEAREDAFGDDFDAG